MINKNSNDENSNPNSFANKYKSQNSIQDITKEGGSGNFANRHRNNKMTAENAAKNASPETQAKRADANLLYLVRGIDDNRPAWYYVLVERLKLHMFKRALNNNIIHLDKYGKILYSAYGKNPPAEIKQKIREEFGISDDDTDDTDDTDSTSADKNSDNKDSEDNTDN